MTTEKLQQRLLTQINENKIDLTYKYILIDEAHEIDEQMIFTLAVIIRYLKLFSKDTKCPLFIIMSATFDLPHFIKYFNLKPDYRDVGQVIQTPESLAMKYKIERNWITCRPETTILYPD